jgi:hypothetical protein
MADAARWLFAAGAAPYLVLGIAHALATPQGTAERKGLSPRDPSVAQSMRGTTILLTRRTDLWLAWVGFNLSHSLGAVAFAAFVLAIAFTPGAFAAASVVCVPLAALVALAYLVLAVRYWFRTPIAGCALALACFVASWLLR